MAQRKSRFQEVMVKMPMYMEKLSQSGAISMDSMADRRALRRKLPASKGIYVLYERGRPMYVGRSDNIAKTTAGTWPAKRWLRDCDICLQHR